MERIETKLLQNTQKMDDLMETIKEQEAKIGKRGEK